MLVWYDTTAAAPVGAVFAILKEPGGDRRMLGMSRLCALSGAQWQMCSPRLAKMQHSLNSYVTSGVCVM